MSSLVDGDVALACVQDAYRSNNRLLSLPPSFTVYSSLQKNCHIIICNPNLTHCQVFASLNSVFINLYIDNKLCTIGSQYSPPSGDLGEELQSIQRAFALFSKYFLLLGDLNAHSPLWGYPREDERGRILVNFTLLNHLIVLNDPDSLPTFELPHIHGWPDISLCSLSLFPMVQDWKVLDFTSDNHSILGDHRPIHLSLSPHISDLPRRRYRTKNVPLSAFSNLLQTKISDSNFSFPTGNSLSIDTLDTHLLQFTKLITSTADETLKKRKSFHTPRISWWTPDLRSKRNLVRALYKKSKQPNSLQEDTTKFKKARALYRKALNEAKRAAWTNFCRAEQNPFGKTKKLAFGKFLDSSLEVLPGMSAEPHSRLDILKFITSSLFGPSTHVPNIPITSPQTTQPLFTLNELRKAIFSFNPDKAPGPDHIDHRLVRAIFLRHPLLLLSLFNSAFSLNYFPRAWKEGELVFFRKEGKPPHLASSYRPITLLPIFGKVYEKLLLKRIHHHLSTTNVLSGKQHGFVERRSTETALNLLLSLISLNKSNQLYSSLISIDFTGAFDNLPFSKSILSLLKLKLPLQIINTLTSFLEDRRAQVHWLHPSQLHYFSRGCPQGSCLGPFLWLALLETLLVSPLGDSCELIAYADDLMLIVKGNSRRDLEQAGNAALQQIQSWSSNNNIKISPDKSFSLTIGKTKQVSRPPIFKIYNENIKDSKLIKYLGVTIDRSLSFLPHVKQKRLDSQAIIQNLYKFTSLSGRLPPHFLKIWYKSILQRKLAYACSVWFPRMWSYHGTRHLLSAQRAAMLLMTRAYRRTSTPALQIVTGLPPLDLQLAAEAEFSQVARLGIPTNNFFAPTFSTKVSKHTLKPSWEGIQLYNTENPITDFQILIYTDGSKIDNQVGAAFCCIKNNLIIHEWKSGLYSENSVFQAELTAILHAIIWFKNSNFNSCLINTDSLSGLGALQDTETTDYLTQTILLQLQSTEKTIFFRWVRGHAGLHGNERADTLAREAAQNSNSVFLFSPFPLSSIKRKLKSSILSLWQQQWDQSPKGRFTFKLLPKISLDFQITCRELTIFLTNHGPFQSYLHKFNRSPSPFCVCGGYSDSLHYITDCPLTSRFRVRRDPNIPIHHWITHILKNPSYIKLIKQCVSFVEKNEFIFKNPNPPPQPPLSDTSDTDSD